MTADCQPLYLFAPNRLSAGDVLVDPNEQPKLYDILRDYFYGYYRGIAIFKPYEYLDLLRKHLKSFTFNESPLKSEDPENDCEYPSIVDYLDDIAMNFGDSTIVVCSYDY